MEFFKRAYDLSDSGSFFWTPFGLNTPGGLFPGAQTHNEVTGNPYRYLYLYNTGLTNQLSHPAGIVLNQHSFKAIFEPSIWDEDDIMFGEVSDKWQPLEVILESFLDMIDQGKVVACSDEERERKAQEQERELEWATPWIISSFTEGDAQESLSQFECLVDAIEARMPSGSLPEIPIGYGALDANDESPKSLSMDANDESPKSLSMFRRKGFARRFLAAVRRPRFQFIAPGLSCVGIEDQPFAGFAHGNGDRTGIRPVLLAQGEHSVTDESLEFKDAFQDAGNISCGLYLTEHEPNNPNSWEVRTTSLC